MMTPATPALSVLGLAAVEEKVYRLLWGSSGVPEQDLAELLGVEPDALGSELSRLTDAGLVEIEDGVVVGRPPDQALGRLVTEEIEHQLHVAGRLGSLRSLLAAAATRDLVPKAPHGDPVEVEAFEDDDAPRLIRALTAGSSGDLLWLRPDQWRMPIGAEIDEWVTELMRSGRRSRAIYPAQVLEEAPEQVRARAEAGEHVRILATVPTRLAVMGSSVALIPQRWGVHDKRRLVVRQESIVRALTLLFEAMWGQAVSVPGLDGQVTHGDRISAQRLLLNRLAAGDKDEQIARWLGLSLRTVRRRVAEILDELGVDSRFQAGVEAVRRGWV